MAINYKFTNPVNVVNLPKKPAATSNSARTLSYAQKQTPITPKISSRPTFQDRLRVKKMMAARGSEAYQNDQVTNFVKKQLDQKIARTASGSYHTDHKKLETSLENLRDKVNNVTEKTEK